MFNKKVYPYFKSNEVHLSKHIYLKLEEGNTNIYIDDDLFRQCKSLIFHIPITELEKFDDVISIDDLNDKAFDLNNNQFILNSEQEFWGHCSNIQAWIENNYNTRILHHSLAFPLLKELYKLGDNNAKRLFKDEVISRFVSGTKQVKLFLLKEGFLSDFKFEEKEIINEGLDELYDTTYFAKTYFSEDEIPLIFDKNEIVCIQEKIYPKRFSASFTRKFDHLDTIYCISDIKELQTSTDITNLTLIQNCIGKINGLEDLTYLRELALNFNKITEIENLDHLRHLRYLSLPKNRISRIKGLDKITKLEFLNLGGNKISKIEGLEYLKELKVLNLWNNKIRVIEGLDHLENLRQLALGGNKISEIQGLDNLKNLRVLILNSNKISEITGIENLTHLKEISLYNNNISNIQDFPNLPELQQVSLRMNPISRENVEYIQKVLNPNVKVYF